MLNFGKSRANLADPAKNKITFDDVAGAEEEKEELREIVDFLKPRIIWIKAASQMRCPPGTQNAITRP